MQRLTRLTQPKFLFWRNNKDLLERTPAVILWIEIHRIAQPTQ